MKRSKPLRVPPEFDDFVFDLSKEFSRQTGYPVNKTATMKRMASQLRDRLVVKGSDFDWNLLRRRKK